MSLVMAAALKLGETLVKRAFTAITGQDVAGELAAAVTSVLGDKALSRAESRRAARLLAGIADTAAEHVAGAYEHEFRGLAEGERVVVIDAVSETFAQVPATELVLAADFDAKKFEQHLRHLTSELLRARYFGQDETSLYELILRRSCVEFVGIVRGLSDLGNRAVPEVLNRLTELDRNVWEAPRRALVEAAQDKDAAFAELYRGFVNDSMDMVKLHSRRLKRAGCYPLSRAYQSLPARLSNGQVVRVEDAIAGHQKVLLVGDCGGGKTTALHRLFMLTTRRSLTGALAPLNQAVPFYLPLCRYADGTPPSIDHLFAQAGSDIQDEMPQGWIQRQLRTGDSLVLLNGVDEVPAARRGQVLEWIEKITKKFDSPRYVLTSRPGGVSDGWAASAGFEVVELLPMKPSDVATFVRRWHDALKEMRPNDAQCLDDCATSLLDAMARCHALRVLSMNPLTCALTCALHFEGEVVLPDQWLDLIRLVVEILIAERDDERDVADSLPLLSREQRLFALQDIAYWMTTEEMTDARDAEVRQRVEHLLLSMGVSVANGEAATVIEYFSARSGLIHPQPDGRLRFTSPIVRDYLAAKEAVFGSHMRFLLSQSDRPERQQLVVMAVGNAQLAGAEELLSGLLQRVDENDASRERLRVLIHECLRAAPPLGSELRQRAEACCSQLMPRTQQEAEVLAATGPLAADVLALQPTDDPEVVLALIHAAFQIGTNDVLPFLARLAADPRLEVRAALRNGQLRFDRSEYDRMVLAAGAGGGGQDE